MAPTSLSSALWRPTSSRTATRSPAAANSAAAWSPPVDAKTRCASRIRPGSARIDVGGDRRPVRERRAAALDVLDRRLAADAAAGGGDERARRHATGVERSGQPDRDLVLGL